MNQIYNKLLCPTAKYMSIAVFRSDYETNCAASTSLRFDRKEARNRQLHIFAERYQPFYEKTRIHIDYFDFD
jgi:hypothetical protein